MTCQTCSHWNLKNHPPMARAGFGTCNLQADWVFFPLQHECKSYKQAPDDIAGAREAYFRERQ
jgi:hypothetical protein